MMLENVIQSSVNRRGFLKIVIASSVLGCGKNKITNPRSRSNSDGPFNIFDYFPLEPGSRWVYNDGWEIEVFSAIGTRDGKEILYGSRKFSGKLETYRIKGDELFLHSDDLSYYFYPDVLVGKSSIDAGSNFTTNYDLYVQGMGPGFEVSFRKYGGGVFSWIYPSLETVEVPAGTFKNCLRLEAVHTMRVFNGLIEGTSRDIYWLAKGIGRVKYFSSDLRRFMELVDYELK